MKLTESGCSTTKTPGTFRYEWFKFTAARGFRVQWDYRSTTGKLYSGIARTVEIAKEVAQMQSGEVVA